MINIEKLNLKFARSLTPFSKKITKLVCHHPAHRTWNIFQIHEFHQRAKSLKGRGWNGGGYNYFVTSDGRIQEMRGRHLGAHVAGRNSNTLGVCFQGHFDQQTMPDAQVQAGAKLLAMLIKSEGLGINDVIGHRDLAATVCPGRNFRMSDLKDAILQELNPNVKKEVVTTVDAKVQYQGKEVKAILQDGRTYVQVRDLAEMLKLQVGWDGPSKTVTLK